MGKILPSTGKLSDRIQEVDNQVAKLESQGVHEKISDIDNKVVQLEKELKVINGHLAKVKEVMKDLQNE